MRFQFWTILGALCLLGGCMAMPAIDPPVGSTPGPDGKGPTVPDLVTHIQCEIRRLLEVDALPEFKLHNYVVAANLTLDVTNTESLSPVLNVITPLNPASTNRTTILGGQLAGTQHRTINLVFTLILDPKYAAGKEKDKEPAHKCPSTADGGLQGDLELKEVAEAGLVSIRGFFLRQPGSDDISTYKSAATTPSFGATIDFSITKAVGGGPQWNLTRFKGPSGSSNLLNFQRINKDTLIVAFAQAGPVEAPLGLTKEQTENFARTRPDREDQAARAAQDNITRMLLQRILPQLQ